MEFDKYSAYPHTDRQPQGQDGDNMLAKLLPLFVNMLSGGSQTGQTTSSSSATDNKAAESASAPVQQERQDNNSAHRGSPNKDACLKFLQLHNGAVHSTGKNFQPKKCDRDL